MTPLEHSSIIVTETRLIPKSKRERKMSQQEQKSFLVKLFGGFVVAFLGFLLIVSLPAPQDVRLPSLPKAPTVAKVTKVAKPTTRHIRKETRPAPSHTYTSSHGTSSERLGGSANPFTQVDGYNEEDAVIYGMLKAAGYSDTDAASATMSSAW